MYRTSTMIVKVEDGSEIQQQERRLVREQSDRLLNIVVIVYNIVRLLRILLPNACIRG